tara:strand:+ start:1140 stop:1331 length:192 start_codon:yes stop_codon:yes gene_type:complete
MSIQLKDINKLNYVNFQMKEVNDFSDNIYESLMDDDISELSKNIDGLIKILNEIKKTHKHEKL